MSDGTELGTTLRETLEANFDSAEQGTLGDTPEPAPVESTEQRAERLREPDGKFAKTPEAPEVPVSLQEKADAPVRPSTWRKEYLPIWDKLNSGAPLTPDEARKLAGYTQQREREYASGVSTYRAEATNAKHLQDAIAPFMPNLQKANINPTQWISNLGRAHEVLALGTPEDKVRMFHKLAQDYGVPLAAIQQQATQGGVPPIVTQLMQQIQALQGQVSGVTSWREQQETAKITGTIEAFAADTQKHPHFEAVKASMAQLLESGVAKDLEDAYKKAVRFDDDLYEQERQVLTSTAQRTNAVLKAKAAAVSVKSTAPSSSSTPSTAKDRRSMLSEQFDQMAGGRV